MIDYGRNLIDKEIKEKNEIVVVGLLVSCSIFVISGLYWMALFVGIVNLIKCFEIFKKEKKLLMIMEKTKGSSYLVELSKDKKAIKKDLEFFKGV